MPDGPDGSGPATVLRCWSEAEHAHLAAHPEPEIATADLTAFALEVACWGSHDVRDLALLDQPPVHALSAATEVLVGLGAMTEDGRATAAGPGDRRRAGRPPAGPCPHRRGWSRRGPAGRRGGRDAERGRTRPRRGPGRRPPVTARLTSGPESWRSQVTRLEEVVAKQEPAGDRHLTDDVAVGLVVALAHPDRIARKRSGTSSYLMASGTGAALDPRAPGPLAGLEWLAVGDAERRPGQREARIRAAAPLTEDLALEAAGSLWTEVDEVTWTKGRVLARRRTLLGAIELSSVPLSDPPAQAVTDAIREAVASEGIALLAWTEAATALRARLDFLHRALGDPWPDVSDAALTQDLDSWLGQQLARVRSAKDLRRIDVTAALRAMVPWQEAGRLDDLAPERVEVPSGSSVRIDYSQDQPVLAVRLQEVFGWTAAPVLAGGRVPLLLHLLSPARRPAAVTADLESFWDNGYPGVRADLRGRYPKHAWPEDPRTAPATARTNDLAEAEMSVDPRGVVPAEDLHEAARWERR